MNIQEIEKIEKAVKILHHRIVIPYYGNVEIADKQWADVEQYYENKVLYYIRTGVNPDELLKKAQNIEEQKNCKHSWKYFRCCKNQHCKKCGFAKSFKDK